MNERIIFHEYYYMYLVQIQIVQAGYVDCKGADSYCTYKTLSIDPNGAIVGL